MDVSARLAGAEGPLRPGAAAVLYCVSSTSFQVIHGRSRAPPALRSRCHPGRLAAASHRKLSGSSGFRIQRQQQRNLSVSSERVLAICCATREPFFALPFQVLAATTSHLVWRIHSPSRLLLGIGWVQSELEHPAWLCLCFPRSPECCVVLIRTERRDDKVQHQRLS